MKFLNIINKNLYLSLLVVCLISICGIQGRPAWAAGQVLNAETIRQFASEFMQNTLQWNADRLDFQVVYEGKDIRVPKDNMTMDCKLPGHKKRVGRVHFMCFIKVAGKMKKRLRLYADVTVAYDVFRPTRSLKAGHVIQAGDVEITRIKSDHALRNIASDPEEVIDHRLMLNLEEGEPIKTHMLRKVPLVKNGDRILIIAQKGSLRVTAPGVVRQNGFKNDTVRVENIHSRKIVLGKVIDSRTVQINF